jgi:hypothetical protein
LEEVKENQFAEDEALHTFSAPKLSDVGRAEHARFVNLLAKQDML